MLGSHCPYRVDKGHEKTSINNPNKKEPQDEGKIIQEHLENINMDPWYYIYQNYVNPREKTEKTQND